MKASGFKKCGVEWQTSLPKPVFLVGVLTETKIISAAAMDAAISVVKNRFLPMHALTTSSRPGS